MMMTARAQLAIVEAAYQVELSDAAWLEGVARACLPLLDRGLGVCAFEFQHYPSGPPTILSGKMLGMSEELAAVYPRVFASLTPDVQARPFRHGPCTTASRMMGGSTQLKGHDVMQRFSHKFGLHDSIWVTAAEPSGWGCGLHAGRPTLTSLSRTEVTRWARIASHLGAAVRLRRRLARAGGTTDVPALAPADAVFSPEGRAEHADGDAKQPPALERLRASVLEMERVRRKPSRAGGASSLERWHGLVDARWSLLDHFESGSKRYIVARENQPQPPGVAALTLRERQVVAYAALGHDNKVIAYDLGIAHSTVRVLMARAAAKFGVQNREQLIAAYETSQRTSPPGERAVPCLDPKSVAYDDQKHSNRGA